jgi:hypothetical protein
MNMKSPFRFPGHRGHSKLNLKAQELLNLGFEDIPNFLQAIGIADVQVQCGKEEVVFQVTAGGSQGSLCVDKPIGDRLRPEIAAILRAEPKGPEAVQKLSFVELHGAPLLDERDVARLILLEAVRKGSLPDALSFPALVDGAAPANDQRAHVPL